MGKNRAIKKEKKAEAKRAKKAKTAEKLQKKKEKKAKDLAFYNSPMEVEKREKRKEWRWRLLPRWVLYLFNYSLFLIVKAENLIKAEEWAVEKKIRREEKAEKRAIKKEKKRRDLAFYNSPMEVEKREKRREWRWRLLP